MEEYRKRRVLLLISSELLIFYRVILKSKLYSTLIMVFNQIFGEAAEKANEIKVHKKIFTCSEIERQNSQSSVKTTNTSVKNFAHIDPAVIFSSSSKMTRYDKNQLLEIKSAKLSNQKPACLLDLNIIKLDITKNDDQYVDNQAKLLELNLQTLALQNFNDALFNNIKNYHQAILNPQANNVGNACTANQSSENSADRRVSLDLSSQQAANLDKILSYDRKNVFFDTITTSATLRAPPSKMNSNHFYPNRASHHKSTFYNPSVHSGYFAANNTRRSQNEMQQNAPSAPPKEEEAEVEPEWYNFPATRHDFVDLHGFNDEEEAAIKSNAKDKLNDSYSRPIKENRQPMKHFGNGNSSAYRHQRQNDNNFQYQSSRFNNAPFKYDLNNNFNSNFQQRQPVNNSLRFRNPLHYNKSVSPKTPTLPPAAVNFAPAYQRNNENIQPTNPFYEAWKSDKFLNQGSVNFAHLMQQQINNRMMPPSMRLMSEVEQGLIQNQKASVENPSNNIKQFFQNFSAAPSFAMNSRQSTMTGLPTREQLEQHTSEIMRNAIIRRKSFEHHPNVDRKNSK